MAVLALPRIALSDQGISEPQAQRERYACGPRAAYILVRMLGRDASYGEMCNHLPASRQGVSLDQMRTALQASGVPCSLRRLQLTELLTVPCPFILHVSSRGKLNVGHFVVVTNVDQLGLHTIDPITSLRRHWRWRSLANLWNGYAIIPTKVIRDFGRIILVLLLASQLVLVVFVLVARRSSHSTVEHRASQA